jgi:hypothetical protein
MKIPLANSNKSARVDREDYDYLMQWEWLMMPSGYAARLDSNDNVVYMHKEVMRRKTRDSN